MNKTVLSLNHWHFIRNRLLYWPDMHLLKISQKFWSGASPRNVDKIQKRAFFSQENVPKKGCSIHIHITSFWASRVYQGIWWCIYPARQGGGQEDLSINSRRGTTGATKRGAGVGGRVGQDRSHSFLRPLHTALFISSAGFSSQELGSNLQSHTDSTWWTMLNSSIKKNTPL